MTKDAPCLLDALAPQKRKKVRELLKLMKHLEKLEVRLNLHASKIAEIQSEINQLSDEANRQMEELYFEAYSDLDSAVLPFKKRRDGYNSAREPQGAYSTTD